MPVNGAGCSAGAGGCRLVHRERGDLVSLGQITHADRAGWQRLATAELAEILHAHRDLPVIGWTVGAAGATLTGQINGLAPAAQVRASFAAWLAALNIGDHTEGSSGSPGVTSLVAVTGRGRVRVRLAAAVFDQGGRVHR